MYQNMKKVQMPKFATQVGSIYFKNVTLAEVIRSKSSLRILLLSASFLAQWPRIIAGQP